ncbi:MAG: thioredoxin domain-containing protein [Pseudomonadota bacterium]
MSKNGKTSPTISIILVLAILLAAAGGYYAYKMKATPAPEATETTTTSAQDAGVVPTKTFQSNPGVGTSGAATNQPVDLANANKLPARVYGNPDAKLRVIEYTSLTCSHCAGYTLQTLPEVKKQFIDTNKIAYEKRDFPLNAPALDAAMLLRCLPDDKADGVRELFYRDQNKWAFEANYREYLKQTTALAGLDNAAFDACLADADLKAKLIADVQYADATYQVRATPSFIFVTGGNAKMVPGQYPTAEFLKIIATEVQAAEGGTAEASTPATVE